VQTLIAQAAALTIFGNDILQGHSRDNFWPDATVFIFCKYARFVDLSGDKRSPKESPYADAPEQWIARLEKDGIAGLRLHYTARNDPGISDRNAVAFVGGGPRWLIEAMQPQASDLWEGTWQVVDKDAPDRKIWGVTYYRMAQNVPRLPLQLRPLVELRADLGATLEKIEMFARRQKLDFFAAAFRKGTSLLSSHDPFEGVYHPDMGPILPLEARRLLGVAQAAWVFGGMGSWNDIGFDGKDQSEYEQLSGQLFSLLNEAICTAANSAVTSTVR